MMDFSFYIFVLYTSFFILSLNIFYVNLCESNYIATVFEYDLIFLKIFNKLFIQTFNLKN